MEACVHDKAFCMASERNFIHGYKVSSRGGGMKEWEKVVLGADKMVVERGQNRMGECGDSQKNL